MLYPSLVGAFLGCEMVRKKISSFEAVFIDGAYIC